MDQIDSYTIISNKAPLMRMMTPEEYQFLSSIIKNLDDQNYKMAGAFLKFVYTLKLIGKA
ncbi:MAG: hypothetical protein INQ03_22910 [Candidatus Heimdallarchaeota archaeon]|nr:hypothetical protein [Candidatus Heimdallarchaeota archaeon]